MNMDLITLRTNTIMETLKTDNGVVMCSSLDVAERFGKRHDNVMQAIKMLEIPEEIGRLNFQESSYTNLQNKEQSCYLMTRDGTIMCSSLDVAERFGKQHKNVIQAIELLEIPEELHRLNFQPMFHNVSIGNGATRQSKHYDMTRDGFTWLVMGFTGAAAMHWKICYTNAFNTMEKERTQ